MTLTELHAAVMPLRTVESGLSIIRTEASGRSSLIGPRGQILAEAPNFASVALVGDVPLRTETPLFTRMGDLFAYLCALAVPLLWLYPSKTGKTTSAGPMTSS
jgi:apolipoprotein N-acyltransferase